MREKKRRGEGVRECRRRAEYFRHLPKDGVENTKVTWEEFLLGEKRKNNKKREKVSIIPPQNQSFSIRSDLVEHCSPFSVKLSCRPVCFFLTSLSENVAFVLGVTATFAADVQSEQWKLVSLWMHFSLKVHK